MIDYIISYTNQLSVLFTIITFFSLLVYRYTKKKVISLEQALISSLASAMIPTSFALIICSFQVEKINQIEGLNLQISVAGLALLYVSVKSIIDAINR